jgi:hypothetical protein
VPTFIDESGDLGFKPGSSNSFHICAVYFKTIEYAEECREAIKMCRQSIVKHQRNFEFKSNQSTPEQLKAVLLAIQPIPFLFVVSSVYKALLAEPQRTKAMLLNQVVGGLVQGLGAQYSQDMLLKSSPLNERVVIDRNGDHEYENELKKHFILLNARSTNRKKVIKSFKSAKSSREELIQLADLLCGATVRNLRNKSLLFDLIRDKLSSHIVMPMQSGLEDRSSSNPD